MRDRLVPLRRLHQVAALLNMPHLDETATHHDAPPAGRRAALYAGIADWARLSAQAAEQLGEFDSPEVADRFAYLIEYCDQHSRGWHRAPGEHSDGTALGDTAETVAETVLPHYITHLAEHRDTYQLWLVESLSLRASVWHVDSAEAHRRSRLPNRPSSACTYAEAGVPPHAVEIRTPSQVHRILNLHTDAVVNGRGS